MAGFEVRLLGPDPELKTITYVVPTIFMEAIAHSLAEHQREGAGSYKAYGGRAPASSQLLWLPVLCSFYPAEKNYRQRAWQILPQKNVGRTIEN